MNSYIYQYFIKQNKYHNVLNMYIQYENGMKPTDFKRNCVFKFIEDTLSLPGNKNYNYLLQNYTYLKPYLTQWIRCGVDSRITWNSSDKISRMMMHRLCAFYGLEHNIDMSNPERIIIEYIPRKFNNWAATLEEWAEFITQKQAFESTEVLKSENNPTDLQDKLAQMSLSQTKLNQRQSVIPYAYSSVPGMPGYLWRAPSTIIICPIINNSTIANSNQMFNLSPIPVQYSMNNNSPLQLPQ